MVPRFADIFYFLVVQINDVLRAPKVASKALDGPGNAVSFQVERSPVSLRAEGGTVDTSYGAASG